MFTLLQGQNKINFQLSSVWEVSFGSKTRDNVNGDRLAYELETV